MSSFFTVPASQKRKSNGPQGPSSKRPRADKSTTTRSTRPARPQKPVAQPRKDEEISGSESDDDDGPRSLDGEDVDEEGASDSDEGETAAEKRLRLAERYLANIKQDVEETVGFDAEDIDRDIINERLIADVAESKGRAYRSIADTLDWRGTETTPTSFRIDSAPITACAVCAPFAYLVSKDLYITKYRIQDLPADQYPTSNGKKSKNKKLAPPKKRPERIASTRGDKSKAKDPRYMGHSKPILCLAVSDDGQFVATGGQDNRIIIWDKDLKPLKRFDQHRDHVTSLAFRRGTNQVYSASKDRTLKIWNLDVLAYIETLFGHQDSVLAVSSLARETCVSVGARDKSARYWKVVEESQLVFRGGSSSSNSKSAKIHSDKPKVLEGSIDCVCLLDEETFVTGGDNGNLSLFVTHKKKAVHTYGYAHGFEDPLALDDISAEKNPDPENLKQRVQPRYITALCAVPYSDLFLSGSWDGYVRAWKVVDKKKIEPLGVVGRLQNSTSNPHHLTNGVTNGIHTTASPSPLPNQIESGHDLSLPVLHLPSNPSSLQLQEITPPIIPGIINDISVFERGTKSDFKGLSIVVAVAREHKLGRWITCPQKAKNGAFVLEIPKITAVNGVSGLVNGKEDVMEDE